MFGPGIGVSDITVSAAGNDLIVRVKDPAHPGAQPTDQITLQDWDLALRPHRDLPLRRRHHAGHRRVLLGGFRVPFGAALSGAPWRRIPPIGTVVGTVAGFDLLAGAA